MSDDITLTEAEQLEVIWWALASSRFWISVNVDGSMVLQENEGGGKLGRTLHQFWGTRAEVAAQLVALRVGDRLEGISHDLLPAQPDNTVRGALKRGFIG